MEKDWKEGMHWDERSGQSHDIYVLIEDPITGLSLQISQQSFFSVIVVV